jgi:hypothetical protein
MSCKKGVILMLFCTEIQTFGRMNTNNAHLLNQITVTVWSPVNQPLCSYALLA